MPMFKKHLLESVTEVSAPVERIWEFFENLDNNYKSWYPEEHEYFKWTSGAALKPGSEFDSLEIVSGHKTRIKGVCMVADENQHIVFKTYWPVSFMCPQIEWHFQKNNEKTKITAIMYYRFGKLFLFFRKKYAEHIIKITKAHMDREGENLKKLMETSVITKST